MKFVFIAAVSAILAASCSPSTPTLPKPAYVTPTK